MQKQFLILLTVYLSTCFFQLEVQAQQTIPTPEEHFGFKPGSDRMLFNYDELIDYLIKLESFSEKILLKEVGTSSMGKPMYIAFISSPENLKNLDRLQVINKKLALNHSLTPIETNELISEGKVFVFATLSMHSNEVGPSQAVPLIVYDLLTTSGTEKDQWLEDLVFMMMPCHNPDGMDMIVDYYNRTKNTRYEGASLPGVYHKYVGHNINRDFITLSQSENKAVATAYNTVWYPQVLVEKHQMGPTGTRYFVPPNHDPIAENIDEGIWNWTRVFGANMLYDMTTEGLSGISTNYLFDNYWPGSTETCIWKNIIGFLTEAANANIASPVFVESNELGVTGKGLSEYKKSINMPLPWPGGWWRLADIVQYEVSSTFSILKTAYIYKEEILRYRNELCKKQVESGQNQPPYFYLISLKQHDKSELVALINLFLEHGVQVYKLKNNYTTGRINFFEGDIVLPLSQPYRAFIKEVMEKQEYPVRRYTRDGDIIKPYDITSWSLPLHRGIESIELTEPSLSLYSSIEEIKDGYSLYYGQEKAHAWGFDINNNESFKAVFYALKNNLKVERLLENTSHNGKILKTGSFIVYPGKKDVMEKFSKILTVSPIYINHKLIVKTKKVEIPSIALIETYFHDMDAGWTRFIFDSYFIPYTILRPGEISDTDLLQFDVVLFPDNDKTILLNGKYKSGDEIYIANYEPSYSKGMEKEGLQKIMEYVHNGGKVVAWGRSCLLFDGPLAIIIEKDIKEEFQLPFRDISPSLQKIQVYCPGSLIRMSLVENHPLTYGMKAETGVFYRGNPAFATKIPVFDMDRRVLGKIPENNILMSGYCENTEKLADTPLLIWLRKNKGQMVLMGFNPQFRASTQATYKLLFNSLLL